MRQVTTKELSSFKILPYDLYNDANMKVLEAGEVLTPGKLIMLKNYSKLFTENIYEEDNRSGVSKKDKSEIGVLVNYSYDTLEPNDFETVINRENVLISDEQVRVKYFMRKTLDLLEQGYFKEAVKKLSQLASIILMDIFKKLNKSKKGSQIRFLGEYEICHPLNVAIVSGMIAKRLEYPVPMIEQVILAGLLHDVGKFKIELKDDSPLLSTHESYVADHTYIGYDIIKNEMGLSDIVAKVALEHHENNDGSGYPKGLSSDYISEVAQIINVANYYDNLACNRTSALVQNNRDVLRAMLEVGTKRFSARMLYTFVHMYTYDDPQDFSDMIF